MSKLKISDLSFCETELPSNSQVHGGLNAIPISSLLLNFTNSPVPSVVSTSSPINSYSVDNNPGFSGYIFTNQDGNPIGAVATKISTVDNGTQHSTSVSAISITASPGVLSW